MSFFAVVGLASSLVSAGASAAGGRGAAESAAVNAENIKSQRIMNEAVAAQKSLDRWQDFKLADSANRAMMGGAMGRDLESDRSVEAFLRRNEEAAMEDVHRIDVEGDQESMRLRTAEGAERRRGRDAYQSGMITAFTTVVGGLMRYNETRFSMAGGGGAGSTLAPYTSMRPVPRPF